MRTTRSTRSERNSNTLVELRSSLNALIWNLTAMTRLEFPDDFMLPKSEDSAADVVRRYFADRGVVCRDDEARRIVRDKRDSLKP
jgi:hypothetical protein